MGQLWGRVQGAIRFRVSRHGGVGCSELEAGMRVAQAFIGIADGESAQCPGVSSWVGSFNVPTWQTNSLGSPAGWKAL